MIFPPVWISPLLAPVLRGRNAVSLTEELAEVGGAGKTHGFGDLGNAQVVLGQQSCRRAESGLVAELGKGHPVKRSDVSNGVALMEVSPGDTCSTPPIWQTYREILHRHEPEHCDVEMTERFALYERAKNAYLIIATGETAIYANVLLKKGVVKY